MPRLPHSAIGSAPSATSSLKCAATQGTSKARSFVLGNMIDTSALECFGCARANCWKLRPEYKDGQEIDREGAQFLTTLRHPGILSSSFEVQVGVIKFVQVSTLRVTCKPGLGVAIKMSHHRFSPVSPYIHLGAMP